MRPSISSTSLRRLAVGRGLLWSGLGAACAAGYLIPYKAATAAVGPVGLVLPMLLVAALLNSGLDIAQRIHARRTHPWRLGRATLVAALVLGVASALGNEAVCRALETINPGLTSVILRTQVIFVAFGGLLLLREPVGLRFWFGVALAIGGYVLLQGALGHRFSPVGVLWATVAAASFGSMQVTIRRTIQEIDPVQVNTLRLILATALVALLPGRVSTLLHLEGRIWLLAGTAALCGPVISRLCLMRALRYLPAAYATLALFLAPVFAYVLAGLVFGAWPGALELLGSLVILIAVALPITELMRRETTLHPPTDG